MNTFFIAHLPPPVNGFSTINMLMLEKLKKHSNTITFDRAKISADAKNGLIYGFISWVKLVLNYFVQIINNKGNVYIGLSGGFGQILDAPFIVISKIFGRKIFIHHHTFGYLYKKNTINRIIFSMVRNDNHIALCAEMKKALQQEYNIKEKCITIISNSAFIKGTQSNYNKETKPHLIANDIKIGYLSNITKEKGIFLFISILKFLQEKNITFSAKIAGPIESIIQEQFFQELSRISTARYIGAVYGAEKESFFDSIDLLIFPSHASEAEPVTIHEALNAGVKVIAAERGCIKSMINSDSGDVFTHEEIKENSLSTISQLMKKTRSEKLTIRSNISSISLNNSKKSSCALDDLIKKIQGA